MSKIYVATWQTESSDRGVLGYWKQEPTEEQLTEIFKDRMPDEFEDDYRLVWWEVEELELMELGEGIPVVESI